MSRRKDLIHALADYEHVVKLRPDERMVWVRCATLRFRKGDGAGALNDLDRAIKLAPQAAGGYFLRGVFRFLIDGVSEQVFADVDRTVALEPGNPFLYACRGFLRTKPSGAFPRSTTSRLVFSCADGLSSSFSAISTTFEADSLSGSVGQ